MTTDDAVMRADAAQRSCDAVGWVELDNAGDRLRPRDVLAMPDSCSATGRHGVGRPGSCGGIPCDPLRQGQLAFQLGLEALTDQAGPVRHRGGGLLAYSVRRDSVTHLRSLLGHSDPDTRDDARAAIAAILSQNHHFFKDREFSDRS